MRLSTSAPLITSRHTVQFPLKLATLIGVNVTCNEVINERGIKTLLKFKENFQERVSELILLTRNVDKSDRGITYIPIRKWLLGSGE